MSKDFTPDADEQLPEKKSSQQLLLLLLLLLILLFVYLYFFTGLIKPRGEEAPKPPAPAEAPVKKPLPPRPEAKGGEAGKTGAPAGAAQEKKAAAQQGKPGAPEAAKPAAAGKPAPAQEAAAAKPGAKETAAKAPAAKAPAANAPAAKAGKETAVKPAPNGKEAAAKPAGAVKEAGKPAAAAAAKPAAPAKGAQPAKETKAAAVAEKKGAAKPEAKAAKEGAAQKPAAVAAKPGAAAAKAGAYALEINGDLAESEVTSASAKLKQAGIGHLVKTKSQKGEPMHRLFLADFANRDEALEELERLKLAAPDAFMLKENGRYAVYAGSYMREAKAASEQNRLQAKGVQLLPKTATLPVAVYKLRAGAFADQAAADRAVKSLKKYGLTASVVKTAKVK